MPVLDHSSQFIAPRCTASKACEMAAWFGGFKSLFVTDPIQSSAHQMLNPRKSRIDPLARLSSRSRSRSALFGTQNSTSPSSKEHAARSPS